MDSIIHKLCIGDGKRAIYDQNGIVMGEGGSDAYLDDKTLDYQGFMSEQEYCPHSSLVMVYTPSEIFRRREKRTYDGITPEPIYFRRI